MQQVFHSEDSLPVALPPAVGIFPEVVFPVSIHFLVNNHSLENIRFLVGIRFRRQVFPVSNRPEVLLPAAGLFPGVFPAVRGACAVLQGGMAALPGPGG